jgi:hypothetical protein
VNGTPNSQSYCEGIVVPEIVAFWKRVKLYFQKITLDRTVQDRPKTFYGRKISMHQNDQQSCMVYHQLSTWGTFLVFV